jgi:hypothetical protein
VFDQSAPAEDIMSVATELTETEFAHPLANPGAAPARPRLAPVRGGGAVAALAAEPCDVPVQRPRPARTDAAPDRASVSVLQPPIGIAAVAPLRLTRRGVIVLATAVALACSAVWWLGAQSAGSSGAAPQPAPRMVTVAPGDTLWAIAARIAPQRDPRAEVAQLQHRNHLVDAAIVPGQVLRVR